MDFLSTSFERDHTDCGLTDLDILSTHSILCEKILGLDEKTFSNEGCYPLKSGVNISILQSGFKLRVLMTVAYQISAP